MMQIDDAFMGENVLVSGLSESSFSHVAKIQDFWIHCCVLSLHQDVYL